MESKSKSKSKSKTAWLVEFCREKNRLIKELTGIDMFCLEDYEDLSTWPAEEIARAIQTLNFDSDILSCPWCIRHDYKGLGPVVCGKCEYGSRHGKCNEKTLQLPTYLSIIGVIRSKFPRWLSLMECVGADLREWVKANPPPEPSRLPEPWEMFRDELEKWVEDRFYEQIEIYLEKFGYRFNPEQAENLLDWLYDVRPGDIVAVDDSGDESIYPSHAAAMPGVQNTRFFLYVGIRLVECDRSSIQIGYPVDSNTYSYSGEDGGAGLFIFFIKGRFKDRYRKNNNKREMRK